MFGYPPWATIAWRTERIGFSRGSDSQTGMSVGQHIGRPAVSKAVPYFVAAPGVRAASGDCRTDNVWRVRFGKTMDVDSNLTCAADLRGTEPQLISHATHGEARD